MQALKGLVVGLGLLIVLGAVLLGYGFYVKFHDKDATLFNLTPDAPAAVAPPVAGGPAAAPETAPFPDAGFGETRLDLPEGCTVTEMRPSGHRLYLRTGPKGLCERIVILDVIDGRVLGTIVVTP
jgi:hypothetical protein